MTVTGSLILRALTVIFLVIIFLVGVISYNDSVRRIDKLRYGFLTVGSLISFIFSVNV